MSRKFFDFSDNIQIVSLILNKEKYLIEQWCKGTTVFLLNHVEKSRDGIPLKLSDIAASHISVNPSSSPPPRAATTKNIACTI
jgi:hypothetical protein